MNNDLRVANYDANDESLAISEFMPEVNNDGNSYYARRKVQVSGGLNYSENTNEKHLPRGEYGAVRRSENNFIPSANVLKGDSSTFLDAMRAEDDIYLKDKNNKSITVFLIIAIMLLVTAIIMAVFGVLEFAPVVVLVASLIIPVSFIYTLKLYNKLETFDFISVLRLVVYGAACYVIISSLFKSVSIGGDKFSVAFTAIKCTVEIAALLATSLFVTGQIKNCPYITIMLSAACAAGGYSAAKCITEGFNSMFISVNVFIDSNMYPYGAIINEEGYALASVYALLLNLFRISIFRPLIFTLAIIISAFTFQYAINKKHLKLKRIAFIPLLLLIALLYSLTELNLSSTFFKYIYTAFALFAALYCFARIMSYALSIKK